MFKVLASLAVSALIFSGEGASSCRATQNSNPPAERPATPLVEPERPSPVELKVLAEGSHSSITNPFIAVVRDAETYSALVKLDGNLPKLDEEFFKLNVVVAAFLGDRNTGGYAVEISREANGVIQACEKKPAKDMMVTQMITSPFKVVSLSARGTSPLRLALDGAWWQEMRAYRITSGRFTMSGGFAGATKQFDLEGQVRVMHQNSFVTLAFELFSHELNENRSLVGFETGVIRSRGEIVLYKMSADSLVNPPNSGLKATGAFSEADNKLSLSFVSLPSMIADGYSGMGNFEAAIVGSTSKQ